MRFHAMPLAAIVAFALPASIGAQRGPALPKEVAAACDAVHAAVVKTPGIRERRSSGSIADELLRAPIAACRIDIDGSFKKLGKARHPTDRVSDYFEGRKWDQLPDFSADGPDGTTFAYRQNGVACLVRGQWDGGADDEPDVPAADPYQVLVLCGRSADFVRR
jgi:hypothetical protein